MVKGKFNLRIANSKYWLGLLILVFFAAVIVITSFYVFPRRRELIYKNVIGYKFYRFIKGSKYGVPSVYSAVTLSTPATGPLYVDRNNPRYFTNGSGKAILLVGDHTWYTMQDGGFSNPPPSLDYTEYLNFLQTNNINFFRLFVFEQAKCSELVGCNWYFTPSIYQRTGSGIALDGRPKFDLNSFNQEYFDRLRQRVIEAGQRGIYVSVQLFDGFSVNNKEFGLSPTSPWPGHPFNVNNNINGINGDPGNTGDGNEIETLSIPAVTRLQEEYVKKVIDTVNDLDNVLFEICNESNGGAAQTAWQNHMIDFIHSYEAGKPKQHPVGFTVEWPGGNNADVFSSHADWVSPNADGSYFDNPPPADGRKVVVNDTDHLCYPCGDRTWVWKSVTRGYNPAFMDPYDCQGDPSPSDCNPNDPTWVSLRKNLGYALRYAERIDLTAMVPHEELASTGYALANPSAGNPEYLVYLPDGGTVTVNLSSFAGNLNVEWFNPGTGVTTSAGITEGGSSRSFTAPFTGDAVLYLSGSTPLTQYKYHIPMINK